MPPVRGRGSSGGTGRGRGRQPKPAAVPKPTPVIAKPKHVAKSYQDESGFWKSTAIRPEYIGRNMRLLEGLKYARRPSKLARKSGQRRGTDVLSTDSFIGAKSSWACKSRTPMPCESSPEDVGWLPGPVNRDRPTFTGPTPGPTDPSLTHESSEIDIMNRMLTLEFKKRCQVFTISHVEQYRAKNPNWQTNSIEKAFRRHGEEFLNSDKQSSVEAFCHLFDVWMAAKIRVAQVKPEVPMSAIWGHMQEASSLHDLEVDAVLTWRQFIWCNRHFSYARPVLPEGTEDEEMSLDSKSDTSNNSSDDAASSHLSDDEGDEDEESEKHCRESTHDTFQKRRELTDLANATFAAAFNPHQHVGLDEATRSTKHWEKIRVDFKASVHSGTLVDMLSDCRVGYCLWFEEQTWHSKKKEGEDINSIEARVLRAARCLVEKGKDAAGRSTSAYCMTLDRGYGHVTAQKRLWEVAGVYSNAMIVANRVGLPRCYIAEVVKDFKCPSKCSHLPDARGCCRFMWTVLHKGEFELSLWQDSKLILSYGNFFSGVRAGELSRGTKHSKHSFAVWAPESIWHYNVEGRSATDTADQTRRKLAMAERRIERAGQKGICFVFDIAFSNGSVIQRMLQQTDGSMTMSAWEHNYNKVRFCLRWAGAVLRNAASYRARSRRVSGALRPLPSSMTTPSSYPTKSSASTSTGGSMKKEKHVLINMYEVAKAKALKRKVGRPSKKKKLIYGRGLCAGNGRETNGNLKPCNVPGLGKRPSTFCQQCRQYYHLQCFFKSHGYPEPVSS